MVKPIALSELIKPEDKKLSPEVQEQIVHMRADPRFKACALLRAFSVPAEIIAEVFDLTEPEVGSALLVPEYRQMYTKWSVRIKELSGGAVFERLLPLAVHVQEMYLSDETADPKVRLGVADKIVDRVKGKPTQSLEVRSLNVNMDVEGTRFDEQIQTTLERIKTLEAERRKILEAKSA